MQERSTILLVEDSLDDVFFFERALRESGHDYDMHLARNGKEAIEYLQRACRGGEVEGYPVPKFVIMDNRLPAMAASDFLRWISENRLYQVIPTVILSGSEEPRDVKLAFELGVHGYFVKPSKKTEFVELLKMIFHYWAESRVPPVKEFEFTTEGQQPVLKEGTK